MSADIDPLSHEMWFVRDPQHYQLGLVRRRKDPAGA